MKKCLILAAMLVFTAGSAEADSSVNRGYQPNTANPQYRQQPQRQITPQFQTYPQYRHNPSGQVSPQHPLRPQYQQQQRQMAPKQPVYQQYRYQTPRQLPPQSAVGPQYQQQRQRQMAPQTRAYQQYSPQSPRQSAPLFKESPKYKVQSQKSSYPQSNVQRNNIYQSTSISTKTDSKKSAQINTNGNKKSSKSSNSKDSLDKLSKKELKEKIADLKGTKLNAHYDKMSKNELKKEVKLLQSAHNTTTTKKSKSEDLNKLSKNELKSKIQDLKGSKLNAHYDKMSKNELKKEVKLLESTKGKSTVAAKPKTGSTAAIPVSQLSNTDPATPASSSSSRAVSGQTVNPSISQNTGRIAKAATIKVAEEEAKYILNSKYLSSAASASAAFGKGLSKGIVDESMKIHYEKQGQRCPTLLPWYFCAPSAQ